MDLSMLYFSVYILVDKNKLVIYYTKGDLTHAKRGRKPKFE